MGTGAYSFWSIAVTLYDRPGVKPALLYLQDQHGLDIPLFLFALWSGHSRRLEATEMQDYLALATAYTRHLIQPLREGRRWLGPQQDETLYRRLLETELACEKALMSRLEERFRVKPEPSSSAGEQGVDNAELYLRTTGICDDGRARQRLALVYRAYRRLETEN